MAGRMAFRLQSIRGLLVLLCLWCFGVTLYNISLSPGPTSPSPTSTCVITEYTEPHQNESRPECFLQRYCLKYEIHPAGICDSTRVELLIYIFSMPTNFQRRQMIRKTWLDRSLFGGDIVQHVFLLGHGHPSHTEMVRREARIYNDIVVINMEESFCSLTLKGIAGLHFARSFCPSAKFVMKTDDDIFVNMFLLQSTLRAMFTKKQTEAVIMGFVWYGGKVFRTGQYAVSTLQYAGKTYPPFCSGSGFIMSMDVTRTLYKLAMEDQSKVLLHLDDPYITGVLADRAKLKHIQLDIFYMYSKSNYTDFPDEELNKYLILHIHDEDVVNLSYQQHLDMWHRLVRLQTRNPASPISTTSWSTSWHVGMLRDLLPDWLPLYQEINNLIAYYDRYWRAHQKYHM